MTSDNEMTTTPRLRQERKQSSCLSVITIFLTVATIILLTAVVGFVMHSLRSQGNETRKITHCTGSFCTTSVCLDITTQLTRNMDTKGDPCQDFVQFACGGYQKRNWFDSKTVHSGISTLNDMSKMLSKKIFEMLYLNTSIPEENTSIQKLYRFTRITFRRCMLWYQGYWRNRPDYKELLDSYFTYITNKIRTNEITDLESFLSRLVVFDEGRLFDVTVFEQDIMNRIDLKHNQTRMLIRTANFEFTRPWNLSDIKQIVKFYVDNNLAVANVLGLKTNVGKVIKAHNSIMSLIERNNGFKETKIWNGTLHELIYQFSSISFDWKRFFRKVFQQEIPSTTELSVTNIEILKDLLTIYSKISTSRLTQYPTEYSLLLFHSLLSLKDFYPKEERVIIKRLKTQSREEFGTSTMSGTVSERMFPAACLMSTIESYSPITTNMYRQLYIPYALDDIHRIVEQLKQAMIENVKDQSWISESGKDAIVKKISMMKRFIGYDKLEDANLIAYFNDIIQYYDEEDLDYGKLYGIKTKLLKKRILQLIVSSDAVSYFYFQNPLEVNAMNFQTANSVVFPLGILAPFLYHPEYPSYLKFGGIGFVIGHEIGHSFDIEGHAVDSGGSTSHLWDKETEKRFFEKVECVKNSYSTFQLRDDTALNANSTVGNDIADLIGLNTAFRAYKTYQVLNGSMDSHIRLPGFLNRYSGDQLFFIQFAQSWCERYTKNAYVSAYGKGPSHSPGIYRILGTLKNNIHFAKSFKCPNGDRMNPSKKCTFW